MVLGALAREELRLQGRAAWEDAKRLQHEAAELLIESESAVGRSQELRVAHRQLQPLLVLRRPVIGREVENSVDRAIQRWSPTEQEERAAADGGAGLVASANFAILVRLEELVGKCLGHVVGAGDAGTVLGLAINTQPDIAIVDSRLHAASGLDVALALSLYAPQTKMLLLANDRDVAEAIHPVRVDVLPRNASKPEVLSWVANAVA